MAPHAIGEWILKVVNAAVRLIVRQGRNMMVVLLSGNVSRETVPPALGCETIWETAIGPLADRSEHQSGEKSEDESASNGINALLRASFLIAFHVKHSELHQCLALYSHSSIAYAGSRKAKSWEE